MGTLKIKRGTTSQRSGFTPALAELVYDSDTKEVYVGDGSTQGGIAVSVSTQNLENLGNVQSVTPQKDQILVYNGSNWAATNNPALDLRGNIYADDSTLLVDAINGKIVGPVQTNSVIATTLSGTLTGDTTGSHTGSVVGNVVGNLTGDIKGSVFADDSTLIVDANNSRIEATKVTATTIEGTFKGPLVGDVVGSVFNDGSSVMVDATNTRMYANRMYANKFIKDASGGIEITDRGSTGQVTFGGYADDESTWKNNQIIVKRQTAGVGFAMQGFSNDDNMPDIRGVKHRGTVASPLTYQTGDRLFEISGGGYDGSQARDSADLAFIADGSVSNNLIPGKIRLRTVNSTGAGLNVATYDKFGTFASTFMQLTPQTAEPSNKAEGMIAVADRTNWDPASKGSGGSYPCYYNGSAWTALF